MTTNDSISAARDALRQLQHAIEERILGQTHLVRRLMIGLLADGHLLVEGFPGLAKTRAIKALGAALDVELSRIQFTPDLLPADITGSEMFYQRPDGGEFRFEPGPVFANLVLADEINRAPAKVQAALLEAMEERQVTVAARTHPLPELFLVMATQNPIEQEGTYPLPEAQLDRFLMHVKVGYPSAADERAMLRLLRADDLAGRGVTRDTERRSPAASAADILAARVAVRGIHVSEALDRYIVDLVHASRCPETYGDDLANWIEVGASPRGSLALDRCARAHAWLAGRDFVLPEDVQAVAHDALRHRLVLGYEAAAAGIDADHVIDTLLQRVRPL
jgi:MoxR-like ATPase